jgi:hypothetical protein
MHVDFEINGFDKSNLLNGFTDEHFERLCTEVYLKWGDVGINDIHDTAFSIIPDDQYHPIKTVGDMHLLQADTSYKMYTLIEDFFERGILKEDALGKLEGGYTRIKNEIYDGAKADTVLPLLGIISLEHLFLLYELLCKHMPEKLNWDTDYSKRWAFLAVTAYSSSIENLDLDPTMVIPTLLTFPIFEKQRKVITAIMKPSKRYDIFFITGAYDEIFFNFQFDLSVNALIAKTIKNGSDVTTVLTSYLASATSENLTGTISSELNAELKVCYLLERLMKALGVQYYELDKMRSLLFLAKIFVFKGSPSHLQRTPTNKLMYTTTIKKFLNFRQRKHLYSTFTEEYQAKACEMKIWPSCITQHYKDSLCGSSVSHWALQLPVPLFINPKFMANVYGMIYESSQLMGTYPFNSYNEIEGNVKLGIAKKKLDDTISEIDKKVLEVNKVSDDDDTDKNPMTSIKPEKYFVFAEVASLFIEMIGGY